MSSVDKIITPDGTQYDISCDFSKITGQPTDNTNLSTVLNSLQNTKADANNVYTKTESDNRYVNTTGDTMSGTLNNTGLFVQRSNNLDISNVQTTEIWGSSTASCYDKNNQGFSWIENKHNPNGDNVTSLILHRKTESMQEVWGFISLGMSKTGNPWCTFPNTNCVDGQWVYLSDYTIASNFTIGSGSTLFYNLSSILPNDSYNYEVILVAFGTTGTASGNQADIAFGSYIMSNPALYRIDCNTTRTNYAVTWGGSAIVPIESSRTITIRQNGNANCTCTAFRCLGYRRIGTNS